MKNINPLYSDKASPSDVLNMAGAMLCFIIELQAQGRQGGELTLTSRGIEGLCMTLHVVEETIIQVAEAI